MPEPRTEVITAPLDVLGERLSELRLCDAGALVAMQRSLEQYGQLTSLLLLSVPATETSSEQLEIIDGFKRVRAARALGWPTLAARVIATDSVDAKLRLRQLHDGRGFTELEEAWLVRSLHRDDGLAQSYIARLLHRHKSWVWRRLMLVESLERSVSSDVRLGLIAPRAAVAVSRFHVATSWRRARSSCDAASRFGRPTASSRTRSRSPTSTRGPACSERGSMDRRHTRRPARVHRARRGAMPTS